MMEPYASDHEDANAQDEITTADRLTFYRMVTPF